MRSSCPTVQWKTGEDEAATSNRRGYSSKMHFVEVGVERDIYSWGETILRLRGKLLDSANTRAEKGGKTVIPQFNKAIDPKEKMGTLTG